MENEKIFEEIDRLWDEEYDPNLKNENAYCHKQSFSWGFQEGVSYATKSDKNQENCEVHKIHNNKKNVEEELSWADIIIKHLPQEEVNVFGLKTRICTGKEQSERLIKLGLRKDTSDCRWRAMSLFSGSPSLMLIWQAQIGTYESPRGGNIDYEYLPAWSLHRLILMCPKTIHLDDYADTHYTLTITSNKVSYTNDKKEWLFMCDNGDLYEMIIDTIEWLIKNRFFKSEYLYR